MKMKKWIGYLSFGAILVLTLSFFTPIRAAVQQIAGLAVAQSSTKWNNVKDAAVGDNLTSGILVGGLYEFDGTNWDRVRGDTTYGLDVDVTRIPAIAGDKTPADAYANPTNHIGTWSLLGLFNGTTWDRARGDITNGLDVDITRLPYVAADNSTNATTKLPVLSGRANAAAPTWTEGYQVPLSVDLSGNLRTSGSISGTVTVTGNKTPADTYTNPTTAIESWSLAGIWDSATSKWNRLKDVASGGSLTSGLAAIGNYIYDETNTVWRRLRNVDNDGETANGLAAFVPHLFNGATYDRARGDTTSGQWVNVKAVPVSGTAFYAIKRADIAAVSVNLAFGFTSKKVVIETAGANTDEICVSYTGGTVTCPALNTAGADRIGPGRSIILDDFAVTSISVISSSGTNTIYVRAFN